MQAVLVVVGLIALVWGVVKLSEPWRKYHEEHIAPLEKELASTKTQRSNKKQAQSQAIANAELFTRDYRAEVRKHQKSKSDAYDVLNPLKDQKSELHDEMDDVRSSLDSWHRRSKSVFGNKGGKIKDDSVLGWLGLEQTVAQKESLESRRETISSEIGKPKDEISDIYEQQIKPAKDGIKAAFDDQNRLKRFRRDGLHELHFRTQANDLGAEIAQIDIEITRLKVTARLAPPA